MPYRWAQILCGLFYENKFDRQSLIYASAPASSNVNVMMEEENGSKATIDESTKPMDTSNGKKDKDSEAQDEEENEQNELADVNRQNDTKMFELIINRLKSRFKARITLQEAINSLSIF